MHNFVHILPAVDEKAEDYDGEEFNPAEKKKKKKKKIVTEDLVSFAPRHQHQVVTCLSRMEQVLY